MIKSKKSKRYYDKPFTYWWDISSEEKQKIGNYEAFEFIAKDTGERCQVDAKMLDSILTPDRRTTRSDGNWGIKVLTGRPDRLAFEPGASGGEWLNLPVEWAAGEPLEPA